MPLSWRGVGADAILLWLLLSYLITNGGLAGRSITTCSKGFFPCAEKCIPESKQCDGKMDCARGEDEDNCEVVKCLPPNYFRCDNGECLHVYFRCDGVDECGDWSDEKDCHLFNKATPLKCNKNEFHCLDGECISNEWVCDGKTDCKDHSDESVGCSKEYQRRQINVTFEIECDGFKCKNKECISMKWHCDGKRDCSDNSDEENCSVDVKPEDCTLTKGFFLCKDQITCLKQSQVCNKNKDCLDGSDEDGLCGSKSCPSSVCNQNCLETPQGPLCYCHPGYKIYNNTCEDIDECQEYGICSQHCVNLKGSYKCFCDEGYSMLQDNRSCEAEGKDPLLVFSTKNEIRGYYLRHKVYFPIQRDMKQVVGIGYDGNYVYWTSIYKGEESISRSRINGTDRELIVSSGLSLPEDLVIDWVTKSIYFTDAGEKHIGVCNNNGEMCTVIVNQDIDSPRAIVVVPEDGYMFWTDWGKKPKIARAGMDGSDPVGFIVANVQWPNALTVDYSNGRLYWIDAKHLTIETVKLDGSDRRVILKDIVKHPYSMAVFEEKLYWSDWQGKEIKVCNKFTGKDRHTILREKRKVIYDVHIFHPLLVPQLRNPCEKTSCTHMCLLAPNRSYSCACPEHMELNSDKRSCSMTENVSSVVVGAGNKLIKVDHQMIGKHYISEIPLPLVRSITDLVYDQNSDCIIISDSVLKKIVRLSLQNYKLSTLVSSGIGSIVAIDYDYVGNNLYWADTERGLIEAYSLASSERTVIIHNLGLDKPLDIALVPEKGYLFVSLSGTKPHIDRFDMDGTNRIHIVDDLSGNPTALAYDLDMDRVFWYNSDNGYVESTHVDGNDRHGWKTLSGDLSDMTVVNREIFWTNHHSQALYWSVKYSGDENNKKLNLDVHEEEPFMKLASITVDKVGKHECANYNGGCSHVCLAIPNGKACACPVGMTLKTDNYTCIKPISCQPNQFKCKQDGKCINKEWRCDGRNDCPSGEDELGCGKVTCPATKFTCANGECVPMEFKCDLKKDCPDGSDEFYCNVHTCNEDTHFRCTSGQCVLAEFRCDSTEDCTDGSDEDNCGDVTCKPTDFRCSSGTCIQKSYECDGQVDCTDGSDEHDGCRKSCKKSEFECANGNCIDKNLVCNGVDECGDKSDEKCEAAPTKPFLCPEDYFKCSSNESICLPTTSKCNGKSECPGGEDEANCGCSSGEFECKNGKCIVQAWVCDATDDCGDESDEDVGMCDVRHNLARASEEKCKEFKCSSGGCVAFSKVCNGVADCSDKSDEGGKCEIACSAGHPCEGVCNATPAGPRCTCSSGLKLDGDGRGCKDVDECSEKNVCSQYCSNTDGSFLCSCTKGYSLRPDRRSCKAMGLRPELVFNAGNQIRKTSLDINYLDIIFSNTEIPVSGLDVDTDRREIYWSTDAKQSINKMTLATKEKASMEQIGNPKIIVLDWITKNVYFWDNIFLSRTSAIKVCNFDLHRCAQLLNTTATMLTSMTLDVTSGMLYWSQYNSYMFEDPVSEIWSSGMDGSMPRVLVSGNMVVVSGLALDTIRNHLYWTDQHLGVVERVSLSGEDRKVVIRKQGSHPLGLVLYEDYLYWIILGSGKIMKCNRISYGDCQELEIHAYDTTKFTIMQEARQPMVKNPCKRYNCTHMCVIKPQGAACVCEDGVRELQNEGCSHSSISGTSPTITRISDNSSSSGAVTAVLVVVLIVLIALMAIYCYKKKQGKGKWNLSLHFQNPSFGLPSFDGVFHSRNVVPGEHQYANPLYKTGDTNEADGKVNIICEKPKGDSTTLDNSQEEELYDTNSQRQRLIPRRKMSQ